MPEMQVQSLGQKTPWRWKWQPTPVCFSGKSRGQRNLARQKPQGHKSWTWLSAYTHTHTHTHTHNGSPAPSAYRIKSKLLISIQPPPMFSTYYKPPLITVHLSSGLPSVPKHSSSLTLQACLFLISLFPNRPIPGQPIKNSLLTPDTNTNSVYLCLFFVCLSHQTVSSMKEEIKSIFPSSFT